MPVGYSAVEPDAFVVVGDVVRWQFSAELLPATEDAAAQYRFEYVEVPKRHFDAGGVLRYVSCASLKINESFHPYEQIARLRKMVELLARRIDALEGGDALAMTGDDEAVRGEFVDFYESVESYKQSTKSELGM